MAEKKKTRCVLCGNLCGLEVQVKDNRIVKVGPDKEHLRSQGYFCRKGRSVAHYQNAFRGTRPWTRSRRS